MDELRRVPVVTHAGDVVPLERLAQVTTWGPGAINSEDARLVAHVAFSPSGAAGDLETVAAVMDSLRSARENGDLKFPEGNFEMQAVGSFQNQIEANRRLMWIVPTLYCAYMEFKMRLGLPDQVWAETEEDIQPEEIKEPLVPSAA